MPLRTAAEVDRVFGLISDREAALVGFLRDFIRIPSIWGDAANLSRAAEFLAASLGDLPRTQLTNSGTPGMPNLVATLGDSETTGVLFNGHMEVYPPSTSWVHEPFGGDVEDGRIYGLGVADMKAGTAAMVAATSILAAARVPLERNVGVLAVPNHFEGGEGTRQAIRDGLRANLAINCEPSGLKVLLGQRGIAYVRVRVHGVASHTTALDIGVNAIERATRAIQAILNMPMTDVDGNRIDDQRICNVAMIRGGIAHNLVPELCEVTLDVRFPSSQTQDSVLRDIRRAVDVALGSEPAAPVGIQVEDTCLRNPRSSLGIPPSHPVVSLMVESHRRATGHDPALDTHRAWPDTPIFWEAGIPAITYGPGSMDCYWDDEFVLVDDYLTAIRTYCSAAIEVCMAPA
jgi:acetylornithine deacetylase/succinyl-diaminopimelate desuccinylase-like protein